MLHTAQSDLLYRKATVLKAIYVLSVSDNTDSVKRTATLYHCLTIYSEMNISVIYYYP